LGLELSNATSSICWIFVPLFDEAHNPKVVGSNPTPATNLRNKIEGFRESTGSPFSWKTQFMHVLRMFSGRSPRKRLPHGSNFGLPRKGIFAVRMGIGKGRVLPGYFVDAVREGTSR
jgi:hypothetical protein